MTYALLYTALHSQLRFAVRKVMHYTYIHLFAQKFKYHKHIKNESGWAGLDTFMRSFVYNVFIRQTAATTNKSESKTNANDRWLASSTSTQPLDKSKL